MMASFTMMIIVGLPLCLILNIESVACLSCVQCSTIFEQYKEKCKSGAYSPRPCPENATYCIKYEGSHQNMDFVFRDCEAGETETGCRHHKIATDLEIEMCFYACSQDGCNSAKVQHFSLLSTAISFTVTYIFTKPR